MGYVRDVSEVLAAIDVGTNSLHLVVARTTGGDRFEVLTRDKEMVRLGSGPGDMRELAPDAIDRTVAALERFRRLADAHGAPVRAVATSAVREADNRAALIDRAEAEAGVEIEVISGVEEARLIHLGVLQSLEVYDRRVLLCDIGGGSVELLIGEHGETIASTSVKLGALRMTDRFFPDGKAPKSAVTECRQHVRTVLSTFERSVEQHRFEVAVGAAGTIEQALRLARGLDGDEPIRTLNGSRLKRKQVAKVVEAVLAAQRAETMGDLPDLDPKRTDIILAGVLVLEGVFEVFGIKEMLLSEYALREGVFLDTVARHRGGPLPQLRDVARRSVLDLVAACDEDPSHSEHVAHLALQLYDATADRHGLGSEARALLEAGALLANVGLVISHTKHHKHSYYLVRNSDRLVGFTDDEIEVVAQIARYHRRSAPKPSHPEWAALPADEQRVVQVAAAVLRVAIGLDRSHRQLVKKVGVRDVDDGVEIQVTPQVPDADLTLDLYAAAERAGLLSDVLEAPVRIVSTEPAV